MPATGPDSPRTPDGRYIVVRGRLWRTADPGLSEPDRARLVQDLMTARRDVAAGNQAADPALVADARRRVQAAKVGLGERGPVWWAGGDPDYNRRMARNTPYRDWFASLGMMTDE